MYTNQILSQWLLFNANSSIFQLYHGENKLIFNVMMKILIWLIDLIFWCLKQYFNYIMVTSFSGGRSRQATGKLYHLRIRVQCTLFCNLQSRARTHVVLVIGLYELLGNQLPNPLSHPGPLQILKSYIIYTCILLLSLFIIIRARLCKLQKGALDSQRKW